jgi:hypothetical protein
MNMRRRFLQLLSSYFNLCSRHAPSKCNAECDAITADEAMDKIVDIFIQISARICFREFLKFFRVLWRWKTAPQFLRTIMNKTSNYLALLAKLK